MASNFKKIKAIEQKNKQRILHLCPALSETSGIYIFYRRENGFKFAYVGQAKHLLTRVAQHLKGYPQHIDVSIKKRGLWSVDNPCGWNLNIRVCSVEELDEREQFYIQHCANKGFHTVSALESAKSTIVGYASNSAGVTKFTLLSVH